MRDKKNNYIQSNLYIQMKLQNDNNLKKTRQLERLKKTEATETAVNPFYKPGKRRVVISPVCIRYEFPIIGAGTQTQFSICHDLYR